jgi:hypothetical protein
MMRRILNGTVRIDGVTFDLLKEREGWSWHYQSAAATPVATTPEEQVLSVTDPSYLRTCGWLDWSLGGVGPSTYQSPVRWLSSSTGPMTEWPRRIVRPPARRRVALSTGTATTAGRVTGIFEGPQTTFGSESSRGVYVIHETGAIRRISLTLNAETVASPIATSGVANGTSDGVTITGAVLTEASPPWTLRDYATSVVDTWTLVGRQNGPLLRFNGTTWQEDTSETVVPAATIPASFDYSVTIYDPVSPYGALSGVAVKLSTDQAGSVNTITGTTNASGVALLVGAKPGSWYLHLSKAGTTFNSPIAIVIGDGETATGEPVNVETPRYSASQSVTRDPVRRSRFGVGTYATGQYLWATSSIYDSSGAIDAVRLYSLEAEQDPFYADAWVSNFGTNAAPRIRLSANREANANGLVVLRDNAIVATADGQVYRIPTGGDFAGVAIPMLDARATFADSEAGRGMCAWRGRLFVPTKRGLYQYDEFSGQAGGTWTNVGPESIRGNDGPIRGKCVLYAGDPEWLYAAFYNGVDTHIMKGRPSTGDGSPGVYQWHAVCPYIPGEEATALHVSSVGTNPTLIIGTGAPAVHFVTLPRAGYTWWTDVNCLASSITDNPSSYDYVADLPDHDALSPSVSKVFTAVRLVANGASTATPIEVRYRIDAGPWLLAGTVVDGPVTELPLPIGTRGFKLGVRLQFGDTTNTSTWTYVDSVSFDFTPVLPKASRIDARLYIERNQLQLTARSSRSAWTRVQHLEAINVDRDMIEVVGPDGIARQAQIDATTGVRWQPVYDVQPGSDSGYLVALRFNLYDASSTTISARYGVDHYDDTGEAVPYSVEFGR